MDKSIYLKIAYEFKKANIFSSIIGKAMPMAKGFLSKAQQYAKPAGKYVREKGQSLTDLYKKLYENHPFRTGLGTGVAGVSGLNVLKRMLSSRDKTDDYR